MTVTTVLLWDDKEPPPAGDWVAVLWHGFGDSGSAAIYSIPRLVEEHADELRSRYLSWIYDLGESKIGGIRLIDRFVLRPGFSYWWMTLPASISYGGTTPIYSAVRLLALEWLATELSAGKVILVSGDKALIRAVRTWCGRAGLLFEWRPVAPKCPHRVSFFRRGFSLLPHPMQAAIALVRHLIQRWQLAQPSRQLENAKGKITFVDYLIHLDQKDLAVGRYGSHYWTRLIELLQSKASPTNWIHHYIDHDAIPSAIKGRDAIDRFNLHGAGTQFHTTFDGALGWRVILQTLRDYLRVAWMGGRGWKVKRFFSPANSNVDFWPFFQQEWGSLARGVAAFSNCLFLNLFEETLQRLPHQESGVFLQENQPWEMAFIHAWKAAGHGRLIGAPHSTVLYWDMRYFFDPRSYQRTGKNDLPLPDLVALNGPAALAMYRGGGFPDNVIVLVEALRYLYLADLLAVKSSPNTLPDDSPLRVLILGDYFPAIAKLQMSWLTEAVRVLPVSFQYVYKPHPACKPSTGNVAFPYLQITNAPLVELLGNCDVVYTSNMTSAAVEAYSAGVPVVTMLDADSFNMSPLRGLTGVTYVANHIELADALRRVHGCTGVVAESFFSSDSKLPCWRGLLGLRELKTE